MDIDTLRKTYSGFSDDEIATALQQTKYQDFSVDEVKKAIGIKPPTLGQQFGSGLKRSFQELPGLAAGVGAFAADAVGATDTRDKLLGYAQERQQVLAKEHVNDAASFSDAWDGKTSWMDFLANASGYVAGQALQSLMTGGVGAGAAKLLSSRGAAQLMEGAAAKAIAAGATEEAAKQASIEALKQATSRAIARGSVAGAGAHNFGMELGSIYPDAVEQAKKDGRNDLDAGDMFRVFASASLAAGVDTAGEAIMASRIFKGSGSGAGSLAGRTSRTAREAGTEAVQTAAGSGAGSLAGRAVREVPAGMAREAGTEAVQTAVEHYGAGQPIADEKGLRDIIDSAAVGAVGGGMGGGLASVRAREKPDLGSAKSVPEMIEAAYAIAFPAGDDLASLLPQPKKPELTAELGAAPPPAAPPEGSIEFESPTSTPDRLAEQLAGDLQLAPQQSIPWQPAPPVPAATADAIANADAVVPPLDRAPRRRVEPVEMQPLQPASPTDPVLGFVDQMRQVNTPQARAFVQDFNAGRITRRDVIRVMQSQGQDPLSPDQRLAEAAAQAPAPSAGGIAVPQVYRSRTKATVEARKVGGTVEPVQGGFSVKEASSVEPDLAVPSPMAARAGDAPSNLSGGGGGTVGLRPDVGQRVGDSAVASSTRIEALAEPTAPADAGLGRGDAALNSPIDSAAHEAATSPKNDRPQPTEAQQAAGNYAKRRAGVDPERDTLLQAVAKMGGLSRDELAREFGMKPEELKATVPVGNLKGYPFRKNGGMTVDGAIEQLRESGYFDGVPDDQLRPTLEEAIFGELGGSPRLSTLGQMRRAEQLGREQQEQQQEAEALTADETQEMNDLLAEIGVTPADKGRVDDDDIPGFDDLPAKQDGRALAQFLGETYDEALHGPEAQESAQNATPAGAGQDRDDAAREAAAPPGADGEGTRDLSAAEGLTLTSQTSEELAQRAEQEAKAKAADDAEQKRLPQPTEAQQAAGNYAKGHARISGLDISIENPQGSTRSGVDPDGKPWSNEMQLAPGTTSPTPAQPTAARVIARVGRTPNTAQAVELRPNQDGTLTPHMEGEAMLDFDSGEPITLPADVTDEAAKQAIKEAGALSSKQNFYAPAKASRGADTERQALMWKRVSENAAGPEYYGRDVDLIALSEFDTKDDFAPNALPLGHNTLVREGNRAYQFMIVAPDQSVLGIASLEVNDAGQIEAIHDIEMTDKLSGAGRKAIAAILANADGPVRINDILDQSEPFWQKMGAGYRDHYGNSTADWATYRAQGKNARRGEGAGPRDGQELEAGRSATGEYEGGQRGESEPAGGVRAGEAGSVEPKARRATDPGGMSLAMAQQLASAYESAGLNRVNVARNIGDLPENLRKKMSGFGDDVRGVYFPADDQVWVFSDKLPDADTLHFVVMHEAFHRGLIALMGQKAQRVLRQMYHTNKKLRDRANLVARELKISIDDAIEEALADMAGEGDVSTLRGWDRLSKLIRDWLAKIGNAVGIKMAFSDKDIETFVAAMARAGISTDPVQQGADDAGTPAAKANRTTLSMPANAARTEAAANSKAGWSLDKSTRLDDLVYELQDKLVDTKQAMGAIRQTLGEIRSEFDPYLQEELYHGRAAKQTSDFLDKEVRPLLREVARSGVSMQDLEKFLHARHAEERNEQIAKVNPSMPDGGSGMTTQEARRYLASLPAERRSSLERLAARVDAITAGTRQHLVDTGLETKEAVEAWSGAYKHYVPLQRTDFDDSGSMRGTGAGFSVRGSSSKRAMGSDRDVGNILANVVMQRERAITRGEKNRVAQAVYGLAIKAPNPGFWRAVDPDANDRTPTQLKELEAELVDLGLDPGDAASVFKEPKQRYVDPKSGLVSQRINPVIRSANNVLALRVNGADRYVFFSDRDERAVRMVSALKNLDAPQMGAVMGLAAKLTRYFSAINTSYNPIFGVINLMRDFQSALLNQSTTEIAGKEKEVARHVPAALKGIMLALRARRAGVESDSSWAKLFDEYERAGGRTGYRDLYETAKERGEQLQREIKRVGENNGIASMRAAFDLLADYNDTMENALRLSAYKVAREQGLAPDKAASLAKNLTVNFNRKGHLTTQVGALYGFFNASAQGTARLIETMKGPRGRKIVAGGLLLGAVQAVLLASAGFEDDQPPEFVRERNFIVPTGDGQYIAIPLPLGLHVLPNLTRVPIEWALGGYKNTAKRIGGVFGLLLDTFNPIGSGTLMQTLTPSILDPIAALAENKDFSGRAIAKQDFGQNETPGHARSKDTATPWAKGLSYAFNWVTGGTDFKPGAFSPTPDQIDYLIGQAGGGVLREASKAWQSGAAVLTGETADLPSYKIPLVGRLYGDTKEPAAIASTYYEHLREMRLHAQEIKGRKENGESISDYLEENPEARYAKMILESEKKIAALRKARKVMKEHGIDDDKLQVFDKRISAAMLAVNERFAALKQPA